MPLTANSVTRWVPIHVVLAEMLLVVLDALTDTDPGQ